MVLHMHSHFEVKLYIQPRRMCAGDGALCVALTEATE